MGQTPRLGRSGPGQPPGCIPEAARAKKMTSETERRCEKSKSPTRRKRNQRRVPRGSALGQGAAAPGLMPGLFATLRVEFLANTKVLQ